MSKSSVAAPTVLRPNQPSCFPEIFRYEAFNGDEGGLEDALRALKKLSRLATFAHMGARHEENEHVGDDDLLRELDGAVECAAMNALAMFKEAKANGKGAA